MKDWYFTDDLPAHLEADGEVSQGWKHSLCGNNHVVRANANACCSLNRYFRNWPVKCPECGSVAESDFR